MSPFGACVSKPSVCRAIEETRFFLSRACRPAEVLTYFGDGLRGEAGERIKRRHCPHGVRYRSETRRDKVRMFGDKPVTGVSSRSAVISRRPLGVSWPLGRLFA